MSYTHSGDDEAKSNPPKVDSALNESTLAGLCGVKINTWGTKANAGNGILHYLDSEFFGGNVGHVSIEITFPANKEGDALIEKYLKDNPKLYYTKRTIKVNAAVPDKKIIHKTAENLINQEIYEVRFSFWPTGANKTRVYDQDNERLGTNFDWGPKWEQIIKPDVRRTKGILGERIIKLGPTNILHARDKNKKQIKRYKHFAISDRLHEDISSLDVLLLKIENNPGLRTLSVTEKNIVNRFFPKFYKRTQQGNVMNSELFLELKNITEARKGILNNKYNKLKKKLLDSVDSDEDENYLTKGKIPSNSVYLPLSKKSLPKLGQKGGLNIERMLQKMVDLTRPDADEFELLNINCSKTVGVILEAGAENEEVKKVFQRRAFGFFGNPQEVLNSAIEVQSIIYGNDSFARKVERKFKDNDPIERAGGYLLGITMNSTSSITAKIFAVIGLILLSPLAAAVFTITKLLNPLQSYKDCIGLVKYSSSREFKGPAKILQWAAIAIFSIGAAIFAIPALIQSGFSTLFNGVTKLFKPSRKKLKQQDEEIERAREEVSPIKSLKKVSRMDRAWVESQVLNSVNKNTREIDSSDPKQALLRYKAILDSSDLIPAFSNRTLKRVMKYIPKAIKPPIEFDNEGDTLQEIYDNLRLKAHDRFREHRNKATKLFLQKLNNMNSRKRTYTNLDTKIESKTDTKLKIDSKAKTEIHSTENSKENTKEDINKKKPKSTKNKRGK